jgi:hypothetical protein
VNIDVGIGGVPRKNNTIASLIPPKPKTAVLNAPCCSKDSCQDLCTKKNYIGGYCDHNGDCQCMCSLCADHTLELCVLDVGPDFD